MLKYAIIFALISLVAGALGFSGVAAGAAGIDWHELRELWLADPRVTPSHTYVYPDNRGWGGKCLGKDTANLCAWARSVGKPASLIEMVRAYNDKLRGRL